MRDLMTHADTEADQLDRRQHNRDQQPEQDQSAIARRRLPAQAALPRLPVARQPQARRFPESGLRGGRYERHGRLAGLALGYHLRVAAAATGAQHIEPRMSLR